MHDSTKVKMDEMATRFFWMNKKIDKMKTVLEAKFYMPILSHLMHSKLAHKYPDLADDINDITEMFGYCTDYLAVEGATEDYEDTNQLIGQLYDWTIETSNQLCDLIDHCRDVGDRQVHDLLLPISRKYSRYIVNSIVLLDKKEQYGEDLHAMDVDCKKWWKL